MTDELAYYLLVENEPYGPYTRAELVEGLMSGDIPQDTWAATENHTEWVPIHTLIQVAQADPTTMDFGDTMVIPKAPKDQ